MEWHAIKPHTSLVTEIPDKIRHETDSPMCWQKFPKWSHGLFCMKLKDVCFSWTDVKLLWFQKRDTFNIFIFKLIPHGERQSTTKSCKLQPAGRAGNKCHSCQSEQKPSFQRPPPPSFLKSTSPFIPQVYLVSCMLRMAIRHLEITINVVVFSPGVEHDPVSFLEGKLCHSAWTP